ncbi:hypothetical protein K402DRAFT_333778 [Aulographum hederae CBS 113979]|uniref:DUF7371 domain-containing protein n=1 Tax=Aulographum hederae CBS 113979 TaxID=1176131 RepID=A0A6G1GY19_9PEZI|nr:hypothetical protein K402DRAFT_333778 [Aulographum hederae CBS 113979]
MPTKDADAISQVPHLTTRGVVTTHAPYTQSWVFQYPNGEVVAPTVIYHPGHDNVIPEVTPSSTLSPVVYSSVTSNASSVVSTIASATPAPTELCGVNRNFTVTWDDTASFTPTEPDSYQYPPVFSPYNHLFFANGYAYLDVKLENPHIDPEDAAWQPVSTPNLAIYQPLNANDLEGSYAAGLKKGEIGAGPRAADPFFQFDAFSVYLGCDDAGPGDCHMKATGYKFDTATNQEVVATEQTAIIPACPEFTKCTMKFVEFGDDFRGLSGIQFRAQVNGTSSDRIFFLDNMALGWADQSCEAGMKRQLLQK